MQPKSPDIINTSNDQPDQTSQPPSQYDDGDDHRARPISLRDLAHRRRILSPAPTRRIITLTRSSSRIRQRAPDFSNEVALDHFERA